MFEYLDYFWRKDDFYGEKLQKSLIMALISKISKEYNIKLQSYNFFRIIKLCAKFGIEAKSMEYLEIKNKKMDPSYYITDEDINKINLMKRKKILEKIIKVLLEIDNKYLMKLIKEKNGPDICRCILDLVYSGLNLNNFLQNNIEDLNTFQKILLSVATNKNEVEYVVKIIKGLIPNLNFIIDNIDFLLIIGNSLSTQFVFVIGFAFFNALSKNQLNIPDNPSKFT